MDRIAALQRFTERLSLPVSWKLIVNRFNTIQNMEKQSAAGRPIIQLYHAINELGHSNKIIESIMQHGFRIGPACNKGYGVYLANHSRYSLNWACKQPVLICDVIYEPSEVKRYRSELMSPHWDSEYVVTNPKLILPRYVLEYDIQRPNDEWLPEGTYGYVPRGGLAASYAIKPK